MSDREKWLAAMRPDIDRVLTQLFDSLEDTHRKVSEAETDRCITIVEGCHIAKPAETKKGEIFAKGWNEAVAFISSQMRDWKRESQKRGTPKEGEPT